MTAPLRLAAVHHGGGVGGAPVSLVTLLAALDRTSIAPRVVFTEAGPMAEQAAASGVSASVVPTGGAFFYSAHARLEPRTLARFVRTFPSALACARRWLRATRPDVLHLNTSVLLAWGAAARREGVPVLWMAREVLGPNRSLRRWHARYLLNHARQVVAISEAVRACFPPDARVACVPNAVDLRTFRLDLLDERPAVRWELGLSEADVVVMAVGSVQQAKGHWLLLEAFQQLAWKEPRARLVLVTGGADAAYAARARGRVKQALGLPLDNLDALQRDATRMGLSDRLIVTGFRHDVARVLTAADVVVFPSLAPEGFGRPLVEAMAMQRPVVATNIGPSAEILGSAGLLVPPDSAALGAALLDVLTADDAARRARGAAGRERVEKCFGLERQVAEMTRLYDAVAGRVA